MAVWRVFYHLRDAEGERSKILFYLPSGMTYPQVEQWADAMYPRVSAITAGEVYSATLDRVINQYTDTNVESDSDLEITARLHLNVATTPKLVTHSIPTILQSLIEPNTGRIMTENEPMASYVSALVGGLDILGLGQPTDSEWRDITTVKSAHKEIGLNRK